MTPQEGKLWPAFLVPPTGPSGHWLFPGAEGTGCSPGLGGEAQAAGPGGRVGREARDWGVQASFATPAHSVVTS